MNGRLQLIEQKLLSINSAEFQNLCDIYLTTREQGLVSLNRTGSQFGKQKTVKGTPDAFFRLKDGSLRYVEYTTQADGLAEKIKKDIDKCLNPTKTGVPANEIHKIIICFNSRLEVVEETAIIKHAKSKNIGVELIGRDWLALEIYSRYPILAKEMLGIPFVTGQILPLQNFIEEYNNKAGKLSTPLDNIFLHRKVELVEIENVLEKNDLLIISGFPGVGKTKIALEALSRFLSVQTDYSAFAISKKDQDISEDLKIYLQQEKNYVLLIDDANRQLLNFKQILGIFREKRKGNIKLVITVRDYARNDLYNECFEFEPHEMTLKKFTDAEIRELISSDSFEIRNHIFQKRIVELSDGNARLAVMAARLAKERQGAFLLGSVFDLYDSYFKTFIKDYDIFSNKILMKTLGINSFFFTIDRNNKEFIESILKSFEMDSHDFNEAIDELEKRELVEVQYNTVRVSEQVMATYFFYIVFIKNEILSFKTLLFNFFPIRKNKFRDTIIPSNKYFGYENVWGKISKTLDEYLDSSWEEEEKILEFFSIFWFYKMEETLNYFHQIIKQLPEPENPTYKAKYEKNDNNWGGDRILDILSKFFYPFTESFIPALELLFEYCRKRPELLPSLIKRIGENLLFDEDDHRYDFQRQIGLFDLLIKKFKEKQPHYVGAFFELSGTFLLHYYQHIKNGRGNSVTFYQYPLPFYEVTRDFRKKIWMTLFENFEAYPKEIFSVIKHFRPGHKESTQEMLEFDLSLLLPFIESKLNPNDFEHILFVHDFVEWVDKKKLTDRSYQKLLKQFSSVDYDYFEKLDWNILRDKQDYESKEQDIRNFFVFKSHADFTLLHQAIKNTLSIEGNNIEGVNKSLDIIVEENFTKDNELGIQLLESIINNFPDYLNPLNKSLTAITNKSEEWALRLWNLIQSRGHDYKLYWQFAFFYCLPKEFVNEFYTNELINTVNSIKINCTLDFEGFEKFQTIDKDIILKILSIAVEKNEKENVRITLWYGFFEKYSKMLSENFDLLVKAYVQQGKIRNNHLSPSQEELEALIRVNPQFLIKYFTLFYTDKENMQIIDSHKQLPFIWDLDNYEGLIEESANLIIKNTYYLGFIGHPLNIFFHDLNEEQNSKAKKFILNYITKYNADQDRMNAVFAVIRDVMGDFFEDTFLHYLHLNTDIENFKKIYWRGGGSYNGDVIIGEVDAKDWQRILEVAEKSKNQLDVIPIKAYIKEQIKNELKYGYEERIRRFSNPNGLCGW